MTAPTCPVCGVTGAASDIGHRDGPYFCSCGSLFAGSESEWRRWARHRRCAAERKIHNNDARFPSTESRASTNQQEG